MIGGGIADTTLLRPRLLTAEPASVYIYDYGTSSIKAFDQTGGLRWIHGRRGSGPGEFRNPIDIRVASDGTIWVIDAGAARIAVVDSTGIEQRLIPLDENILPQQLVLLDTAVLAILFTTDERFVARFDESGSLDHVLDYPAEFLSSTNPNLRLVRADSNGRQWVAAFVFDGSFLAYDNETLICTGRLRGAERLKARGQEPGNELEIAAGVVVTESNVWVLGIPVHDRDTRFVDQYGLNDCSYKQSFELPVRAQTIARHDSMFVFSHEDPAPEVVVVAPEIR